jgi:hypothetical protein
MNLIIEHTQHILKYILQINPLFKSTGAKRQDIKAAIEQKPISPKSALLAPIVSSAVILSIYTLLKYTDIEIFFDRGYQFLGM